VPASVSLLACHTPVRGLLRVGFVLATEGPALSRLIAAFQARYPACEVRLQEVETFDAYRALRRGTRGLPRRRRALMPRWRRPWPAASA
jgi:DNA-binding transcriptional LysR family regulator